MIDRNKYAVAAPWIVLVLGLLLIGATAWLISFSKGYQAADEEHQAQHAANYSYEEHTDRCFELATLVDAKECVTRYAGTTREAQRAEQDLNAQREMAQWAEGMLWATLFTIVITAAGTLAIFMTLIDSKRSIRAAEAAVRVTRDVGEAQTRAYISPPSVEARIEDRDGTTWFLIKAYLRNSGNSPALFPRVSCKVLREEETKNLFHAPLGGDVAAGEAEFLAVDQAHPIGGNARAFFFNGGRLFFEGSIFYHTVFGGPEKRTTFCFELTRMEEGYGALRARFSGFDSHGRPFEHRRD